MPRRSRTQSGCSYPQGGGSFHAGNRGERSGSMIRMVVETFVWRNMAALL